MSKEAEISMLINAGIVDDTLKRWLSLPVSFAMDTKNTYQSADWPSWTFVVGQDWNDAGDFVTGIERSFINKLPSASAKRHVKLFKKYLVNRA